ncbi:MAG: class II aldolase/adducin family protein [Spirochaetaceae bacterium]|nr:class II aldolase/adducin family protein [Spirochaetaceae bacterium]
MSIAELVEVSRRYGGNPEYVLGGGGNTSWKSKDSIFVKASGTSLGTIDETGFVALDLQAVRDILCREFPVDSASREATVLSALMNARRQGQTLRPSVETILHALFPFAYVVHTHPALVNGLLCSMGAEKTVRELFGDAVIWVPYTTPGYVLSKTLFDRFAERTKQGGPAPSIVFLQNHGIFVAADSVEKIDSQYSMVFETIRRHVRRSPDFGAPDTAEESRSDEMAGLAKTIASALTKFVPTPVVKFEVNREILRCTDSESSFASLMGAFSPDHIVYAGVKPLFVPTPATGKATVNPMEQDLEKDVASYAEKEGTYPRIIAVEKLGAFAIGKNEKTAQLALSLFMDAIKVSVFSQSFGGPRFMAQPDVDFIRKWEVEQYRTSVSS